MRIFEHKIILTRLRCGDPSGLNRRLYSIRNENLEKELFLVVPSESNASYRFVMKTEETIVVITLEPSMPK